MSDAAALSSFNERHDGDRRLTHPNHRHGATRSLSALLHLNSHGNLLLELFDVADDTHMSPRLGAQRLEGVHRVL